MKTRDLATLPAGELRKRCAKAYEAVFSITKEFIEVGRGNETGREIRRMTDPLAVRYIAANDKANALREEQEARRRYHGGDHPIRRKVF